MREEFLTTLYWAIEYGKVFLAYGVIMFAWPAVIFGRYLTGKTKTFRFAFCVTVQPVLVNTVVLLLGLVHLLYPVTVRALFYGAFLYCAMRKLPMGGDALKRLRYLANGTYGRKLFRRNAVLRAGKFARKRLDRFRRVVRGHVWEYGLLAIIVAYGMIYFTYGAFQDYSYGFGDLYPHNAWIYGLTQGKPFSGGVYPEGMHCFLYAIHVLFGVRIYSCLLFAAGIHVAVLLVSAYILLREVFRWRYAPMLALTLFLTLEVMCINEVYSMSRLQWTLPQEFGFYTLFLCAAFLVKYLREAVRPLPGRPRARFFWSEDLIVFALALAASLAIHFYATIMAFFLCVAFVPTALGRIFHYKRFVPLAAGVAGGFLIAVLPMAGALASGIPFQKSIGWAMTVIDGTDAEGERYIIDEETGEAYIDYSFDDFGIGAQGDEEQEDLPAESAPPQPELTFQEKLQSSPERARALLAQKARTVYDVSYATLYGEERADVILGCTALAFLLWLACRVGAMFLRLLLRGKREISTDCFDGYFSITLASVIYMVLYSAGALGLPSLVAGSRLCSVAQLLIVSMMVVPVDLLFAAVGRFAKEGIMKAAAALCVAGIYGGTIATGTFHGYLYYELTRYNAAVMATYSITEKLPKSSYTIVSTVDELYQEIQYGFHEEAITFVNRSKEEDYTLPTEYVFIYVEKKPLKYAQNHFFSGPDWLAWEKYPAYYGALASQCPDITASEISEEMAGNYSGVLPNSSNVYSDLVTRTIVESQLREWCREFERLYPGELKVYYEDDDFVCYYFRQNVMRLYELAIR